jgi:type VI secretion system protein
VALQLRIISDHRRLLGERSSVVFDGAGGNIGRAADNDWVLPDPQRFVSAHHARIHHRDGLYVLEDTSTNGVYVNDDDRPLAKRGAHVLQNGDIIRFGEYQVVAVLESRVAAADPAAALTPLGLAGELSGGFGPVTTGVEVVAAIGRVPQTDLGASLDLDDLLEPDGGDFRRALAVNAYGQPLAGLPIAPTRPITPATPEGRMPAAPSASELSAMLADSETERRAIARRIERLARAAARAQERRSASGPPIPVDVNSGLSAFCKGAGIAADHFSPELQGRMLHLVGQLVREALVGLKDLERARSSSLRPMQIEVPLESDDPRPSLARASVEDLLVDILSQHESRRLDAVQWLREAIERAKEHDRATFAALRTAFLEFIARLEPAELELRFQRHARGTVGGAARNWELYTEFFRSIAARTDGQLPRVFLDAFGTAYDESFQQADQAPDELRNK